MFTFIEKMASLLLSATKAFQEHQDRKRRRDFGKDLFDCYLRLIEIISTGKGILQELEFYDRRFREHLLRQDNWVYIRSGLERLLINQSINLERLGQAYSSIRYEMQVLAPDIAEEMSLRIHYKLDAIHSLTGLFRSGKLPTKFNLIKLKQEEQTWLEEQRLECEMIDTALEWDKSVYDEVQAYLVSEVPRERIKTMERSASQIRE